MITFKNQIRKIFNDTKEISCPAFAGEVILFNAKGINHLLYKGNRSKRDISRIQTNIRLLPRAIKVLRLMPFYQEESWGAGRRLEIKLWPNDVIASDSVACFRKLNLAVNQQNDINKNKNLCQANGTGSATRVANTRCLI